MKTRAVFGSGLRWLGVSIILMLGVLTVIGSNGGGNGGTPLDTDGDGLTDAEEVDIYFTSPLLDDTDGDGLSDNEEVTGGGNNPLIANVPRLEVDFVGGVTIDIPFGVNCGLTTDRINATMNQSQTSFSRHAASSTESTVSASASLSYEASINYPWSGSVSTKASYTASASTTRANSSSWDRSSAQIAQEQYQEAVTESCFTDTNAEAGKITMGFNLTNTGTLTFRLDSLDLTVLYRDPYNPLSFLSLVTVDPLSGREDPFTLQAGESTGTLTVIAENIATQRARNLLLNPAGLFFEVGAYTMTEEGGRDFAFINDITSERTAVVTIDYGASRQDQDNRNIVETYLVATNVERNPDGSSAGVSMARVMEILDIPYTTETSNPSGKIILASVDSVKYDQDKRQFWLISGSPDDLDTDVEFADVRLYPRDFITLTLLRDSSYDPNSPDNDLMFDREEYVFGTDPSAIDTDGDGLSDSFEIKTGWTDGFSGTKVYSSPLIADSDGDGLSDDVEFGYETDPLHIDTDRDGLADASDAEPIIPAPGAEKIIRKVAAGHTHSMAIDEDGGLWVWGNNTHGQLGLGDFEDRIEPIQEPSNSIWVDVAGGENHTLAIREDGTLWVAGINDSNQLGSSVDTICPDAVTACSNVFVQVGTDADWNDVEAGANHNLALKSGSDLGAELWAWGANNHGQLGLGDNIPHPTQDETARLYRIGSAADWGSIAAGWDHSLASKNGDISQAYTYTWGENNVYQSLGPNTDDVLEPPISPNGIAHILSAGKDLSLAVNYDNEMFMAGRNEFNDIFRSWAYTQRKATLIATGSHHLFYFDLNGFLYALGNNSKGQIGVGEPEDINFGWTIVNDPGDDEDKQWTGIATAHEHNLAVRADGSVFVWGDNSHGQLGDGTISISSTPKRIVVR